MPVKGVVVTLYGQKLITNPNGCFAFDVADALPFELSASAPGFKNVAVPSKAGFFVIYISLAPVDSTEASEVRWEEISSREYKNTEKCT